MQPAKLARLSKMDRQEKLATLSEENVQFPASFILELMAVLVREGLDSGADMSKWVERLNPVMTTPEDAVPDAYNPSLHDLPLESVDKARALTKIMLKDILIHMIAQGEGGAASLAKWCSEVQAASWGQGTGEIKCPLVRAAIEEVMCMSRAVVALYHQSLEGMPDVSAIMNGQSGNKYLLRAALSQNGYWKELHKSLLSNESIQRHLGPELLQAEESVRKSLQDEKPDLVMSNAEAIAKKVTYWRTKTPAGTTLKVEQMLLEGLQWVLQQLRDGSCPLEVAAQLPTVASTAASAVITEGLQKKGLDNAKFAAIASESTKIYTETVEKEKIDGLRSCLASFQKCVSEPNDKASEHQARVRVYGNLQEKLQSLDLNNEALPSSLHELAASSLSDGVSALTSAFAHASGSETESSRREELLAEASLLQNICSRLSPDEQAYTMKATQEYLELAQLLPEMTLHLTPLSPTTARVATQMMDKFRSINALDLKKVDLDDESIESLNSCMADGQAVYNQARTVLDGGIRDALEKCNAELKSSLAKAEWRAGLADDALWKDIVAAAKPILLNEALGRELVKALTNLKKEI